MKNAKQAQQAGAAKELAGKVQEDHGKARRQRAPCGRGPRSGGWEPAPKRIRQEQERAKGTVETGAGPGAERGQGDLIDDPGMSARRPASQSPRQGAPGREPLAGALTGRGRTLLAKQKSRRRPAQAADSRRKGSEESRAPVKATAKADFGDERVTLGAGGETHQLAGRDRPILTTQQGTPVSDDQNSLKQGPRGPHLLEDQHFREKIFHFDHERIPERVVHARGYGAHGFFEGYGSLAKVTAADVFPTARGEEPRLRTFLDGCWQQGAR